MFFRPAEHNTSMLFFIVCKPVQHTPLGLLGIYTYMKSSLPKHNLQTEHRYLEPFFFYWRLSHFGKELFIYTCSYPNSVFTKASENLELYSLFQVNIDRISNSDTLLDLP